MDAMVATTQLAMVGMANQLVSAASAGDGMRDTIVEYYQARLEAGGGLEPYEVSILQKYATHSGGYLDQLRTMTANESKRKRAFVALLAGFDIQPAGGTPPCRDG
jgi:hypothetical protein